MSLLRARKTARHAKPSQVGPTLAAGGITAAFLVADGAVAAVASAASPNDFARLRACESGDNYKINTGNGYYGAYQFAPGTWRSLGYSGLPHQAAPAVQDEAAAKLQASQGWKPWPGCARKLGLTGGGGAKASAPAAKSAPAKATKAGRSRTAKAAPAFPGTVLSTATPRRSAAVKQWQQRMRDRGWRISVDGAFGPQSASVAKRFAAQKGLRPATPGTVDRSVWTAAWTAPVS